MNGTTHSGQGFVMLCESHSLHRNAPPRQLVMSYKNNNVGYQLYIQILAQYNSEVLHACRRERVRALTAWVSHVSNFCCRRHRVPDTSCVIEPEVRVYAHGQR